MPLDLPGPFPGNTDTPLAGEDINAWIRAASMLDAMTYRRTPLVDSAADPNTGAPARYHNIAFRQSAWGILYRAGMTSIVVEGFVTQAGSESIALTYNGVAQTPITANGAFTRTITLSGLNDGDYLEVALIVPATAGTGQYIITDVYATLSTLSGWSAPATFGSSYAASSLDNFNAACQWLWDAMQRVPQPLGCAQRWTVGGRNRIEISPLRSGGALRGYSQDALRIYGTAQIKTAGERLIIKLDGSTVYTGPTWGPGTYAISLIPGLTNTVGTRARLEILAEVTTLFAGASDEALFSRYCLDVIRSEGTYPAATPPSPVTPGASLAHSSQIATLNAIGTMLSNAKSRLDANSAIWGRVRLFRHRYGYPDADGNVTSPTWQYPHRGVRSGGRLVVRGRNVTINWGAPALESPLTKEHKSIWPSTQQICDAENITTQSLYFDTLKTLNPGQAYYLTGEVRAAYEDDK